MRTNLRLAAAAVICAALAAPVAAWAAAYPAMAPLAQYMIADRNAEVALARTAAPPSISDGATVLVLGRSGYETAVKGTNGFTCLVERAWMSPFDHPEFWNPKNRSPVCYNPPAARSILPYTIRRTQLVLAGQPKAAVLAAIKAAVASKALPSPEPGAMSYMMSPRQYLNDGAGSWMPHLMFHVPRSEAASWGANLPGSPIILDTSHKEVPEPESIFMVSAGHWSDGTPFTAGPAHRH